MMQIVINIADSVYEDSMYRAKHKPRDMDFLDRRIAEGIVLPKEHGRLIDADAYIFRHSVCGWLEDLSVDEFNNITPTIIERG